MKHIKATLIMLLITVLLFSTACGSSQQLSKATPAPSKKPSAPSTPMPKPPYTLSFNNPVFIGCTHAILSAQLNLSGDNLTEHGFILEGQAPQTATLVDGVSYVAIDGLAPNSEYTFNLWYVENGETKTTEQGMKFKTPKRNLSFEKLDEYIAAELKGKQVTDENRVLMESQACLSLLGLESDRYGKWGAVTQANLTRMVYTANALSGFVDYSHITATADDYTLNLLKDVLSYDIMVNGEALIHPFVLAPHALTTYAVLNDAGGSLDIERYIAELTSADDALTALYNEYPYDVDADVFKEKYAKTIASDEFSEQGRTTKLTGYAAKNKAMFAYKANDWMEQTATPKERLVTFANSENQITVKTYVAYAYMLIDAYRATGDVLATSTTYRDVDKQWYFYSKKQDRSVAYRLNGSWHLERQVYSYVPGFSNHQYGVAIDFYERNSFGDTDLFEYLQVHGNQYGFYNYYLEPWHWVYLGKTF